jgi:hypothetical protein
MRLNNKAVGLSKPDKTKKEKYWFTVCCLKVMSQFLNISSANKVAILCSVGLLCLLNCITETTWVTEDRMLTSPALFYAH